MSAIRPEFVEVIPASLMPGVLYISERYRTASHLCPCGCGEKVVTPLSPADWKLIRKGSQVSLHPSIGNWNYACRSHYWIRDNQITWSGGFTEAQVARVQQRDRLDKARWVQSRNQERIAPTHVPGAPPIPDRPPSVAIWKTIGEAFARFLQRLG